MYKIDRRGGGSKNRSLGIYRTIFGTLPHSYINFEHDLEFNYFQQLIFILHYFRVKLGQFLSRALQLGQARGPSAAARTVLQFHTLKEIS